MSIADISNQVRTVFQMGIENGDNPDEIKMEMIKAGETFGRIHRVFATLMKENNLYIPPVQRKKTIERVMEMVDPSTEMGFSEAVENLERGIPDVDADKAERIIRSWCKKNKLKCWKPASESLNASEKFMIRFLEFIQNPEITESEVEKFIDGVDGYKQTGIRVKNNKRTYLLVYRAFSDIMEVA